MDLQILNKSAFSNPYSEQRKLYSANQIKTPAVKNKTSIKEDTADISVNAKMTSQLNGLVEALRNMDKGRSFVKTTDNHLVEIEKILQIIRKLAIRSANGTNTDFDRQQYQVTVSALVDEIDRIASQAEYNNHKLLLGDYSRTNPKASMWIHVGPNVNERIRLFVSTTTATGLRMKETTGEFLVNLSSLGKSNRTIGIIDDALQKVSKQRSDLQAYMIRLKEASRTAIDNINEILDNDEINIYKEPIKEQIKKFEKRLDNY